MRVRLGTPFQAGVVQQENTAVPRLRRRCDSVHPLHFRGCSSSAERSFDMREAKRAARFFPTIFEGIAQPAVSEVLYSRAAENTLGLKNELELALEVHVPECVI